MYGACMHEHMHVYVGMYACVYVCLKLDFAKEIKYLSSKSGLLWLTWWSLIPFIFLQMTWIHSPFLAKKYNSPSVLTTFSSSCHWILFPYLGYCECCSSLASSACWRLLRVQEWWGRIYGCWILVFFRTLNIDWFHSGRADLHSHQECVIVLLSLVTFSILYPLFPLISHSYQSKVDSQCSMCMCMLIFILHFFHSLKLDRITPFSHFPFLPLTLYR